ncbi:MAG: hypothetical protein FWC23_04590 [Chitinispirillia bacterium]|nr:hypothetical protein [Chitinispirillia bacterium]MCL2268445.1 hypothetical protein [Chitinispirillia bacterium]
MRNFIIILAITLCAQAILAQGADTSARISTDIAADSAIDTAVNKSALASPEISADTSGDARADIPADTLIDKSGWFVFDDDMNDMDEDERILAEIALDTAIVLRPDVIRREHNYRRQTRLAIVMMAFIAVAMTTAQSWNPR